MIALTCPHCGSTVHVLSPNTVATCRGTIKCRDNRNGATTMVAKVVAK